MTFKLLLEARREDKKNPHQNRRYEKPDLWKHTHGLLIALAFHRSKPIFFTHDSLHL